MRDMERVEFPDARGIRTCFVIGDGRAGLEMLCGTACAPDPRPPETDGLCVLRTSLAPAGHRLSLAEWTRTPDGLHLVFTAAGSPIGIVSDWTLDPATGVWSRRDRILHAGSEDVRLHRALGRIPLAASTYRVRHQASVWGAESQDRITDLPPGAEFTLHCDRGRLCVPATPYVMVQGHGNPDGLALHLIATGDWTIRVRSGDSSFVAGPAVTLDAGLADAWLDLPLPPGGELRLPELLYQHVPSAQPHRAAAPLHRHLLDTKLTHQKKPAPVVYNTWFDVYDNFDEPRLRRSLAVAKDLGAEVFTVDAGWYGTAQRAYDQMVGYWHENPAAGFKGQMKAFAAFVREQGLGFGLWMEPERVARTAPLATEHPEWLIESAPGREYRVDFENPAAYSYMKGEISRLITTYGLVWMKLDSNFPPGLDPRGGALTGYFTAWHRLLDEIRSEHPGCFLEACSSGSLRHEIATQSHHDAGFLSDNVTPLAILRILEGQSVRIPPARTTLWTVLRHVEGTGVVAPKVHHWEGAQPVDPLFLTAICFPGILTLSGDLTDLPEAALDAIRHRVARWKRWRPFLADAHTHPLTGPRPVDDPAGWSGFQMSHPKDDRHLITIFRLDDRWETTSLPLRDLDPDRRYTVTAADPDHDAPSADSIRNLPALTGAELMSRGLPVRLAGRFSAALLELRPA